MFLAYECRSQTFDNYSQFLLDADVGLGMKYSLRVVSVPVTRKNVVTLTNVVGDVVRYHPVTTLQAS